MHTRKHIFHACLIQSNTKTIVAIHSNLQFLQPLHPLPLHHSRSHPKQFPAPAFSLLRPQSTFRSFQINNVFEYTKFIQVERNETITSGSPSPRAIVIALRSKMKNRTMEKLCRVKIILFVAFGRMHFSLAFPIQLFLYLFPLAFPIYLVLYHFLAHSLACSLPFSYNFFHSESQLDTAALPKIKRCAFQSIHILSYAQLRLAQIQCTAHTSVDRHTTTVPLERFSCYA